MGSDVTAHDQQMVWAMAAMAFLTFAVMLIMLLTRVWYVRRGAIAMSYFEVFAATGPLPPAIVKTGRHVINHFELPVLFYVGCLTTLYLHKGNEVSANMGWLFVGSRLVHSVIHLTFNAVTPRLVAFLTGWVALVMIWLRILG